MNGIVQSVQTAAKSAICAVFLALLVASTASTALGQAAPAPIGRWAQSPPGQEALNVYANGQCAFWFKGKITVAGSCTWQASSRGGILTITYPMPLTPGHVRYNIVWVNQTTISVFGDIMHKLPG
jgi:hypothetical protein